MGIVGRPGRGVFAAVDVHYLSSGGARAAAVVAADAAFSDVLAEHSVVVPGVLPYRPGEFYLRELPPMRAVLDGVRGLGLCPCRVSYVELRHGRPVMNLRAAQ
jgi:hypothetical protein